MQKLTRIGLSVVGCLCIFSAYSLVMRKKEPPIFYCDWLPFGFNGLSLPPFGVFIRKEHKNQEELLLHELVHWKQYQREGLAKFLFGYIKAQNEVGYDKNPYEIEARYRESDFAKSNYTYAVRNGLAKTVHNPNFRNGRN